MLLVSGLGMQAAAHVIWLPALELTSLLSSPSPPLPLPLNSPDQVVELSPAGRAFFASAFERFDVDDDGVLSAREREEMFSTAPAE